MMPRLTVWAFRVALLHLLAGFTIGALLLFHKGVPIHGALWRLRPAHQELLLLGWTAQLALAVSFWIFPRFREPPKRGNVPLAWLAFWLLNAGVLLVAFGTALGAPPLVVLAGRLAEAAAALAFAWHAFPRVRGI